MRRIVVLATSATPILGALLGTNFLPFIITDREGEAFRFARQNHLDRIVVPSRGADRETYSKLILTVLTDIYRDRRIDVVAQIDFQTPLSLAVLGDYPGLHLTCGLDDGGPATFLQVTEVLQQGQRRNILAKMPFEIGAQDQGTLAERLELAMCRLLPETLLQL